MGRWGTRHKTHVMAIQSFILLMKFITGPSENIKNSLIPILLHLFPNYCSRASKCSSLLKKNSFVFTLLLYFTTKLKSTYGIHTTESQYPQNKLIAWTCILKRAFSTPAIQQAGERKTKSPPKNHSIASLPSINEIHPTLPGGKSFQ